MISCEFCLHKIVILLIEVEEKRNDSHVHRCSNTIPKLRHPEVAYPAYAVPQPLPHQPSRKAAQQQSTAHPASLTTHFVRSIPTPYKSFEMNTTISSYRPIRGTCRCMSNAPTSALDMQGLYQMSTRQCHCRHAGLNRAVALLARSVYTWKSPALLRHQ
jgi:hypothetical protein